MSPTVLTIAAVVVGGVLFVAGVGWLVLSIMAEVVREAEQRRQGEPPAVDPSLNGHTKGRVG